MSADNPCFERLQVIRDPVPRAGTLNMAIDEVLLGSLAGAAVLRVYRWKEPTISFGCFEPVAAARKLAGERPVVRRWTGGGIVVHGEDFTYSLCVPRASAFTALRGAESYRRIHAAVARALRLAGASAVSQETPPPSASGEGENACFERPVQHDLLWEGRKIAGGAQRRTRAGLLHQGSVQMAPADPAARAAWGLSLGSHLPGALALRCEERAYTAEELERAASLAATRYATVQWTARF